MANKEIAVQLASPDRYFTKCYHDFIDCNLLNGEEKILFLSLKRFVDVKSDNGNAHPTIETLQKMTGWGNQKVVKYIKSLVKKGVVKKIRQGLKQPNLYIVADFSAMWACDNVEDVAAVAQNDGVKPLTAAEHIAELERMGYIVEIKKKGLVSEPTKAHSQAPITNNSSKEDDTTAEPDCQEECQKKSQEERYSMEQMKQLYDYDVMIADNPYLQQDIDSVMEVLHTTVNTTKRTIRVAGENKPAEVVVSKLTKLTYSEIIYVIERYQEQTERIKNPTGYLLTMLFNAKEQMNLDIANQVAHDMARWKTEK